tara:strand:+ start:278 stop:415 length:138 start_codon:yes stop_codon:yes gene_type:complete
VVEELEGQQELVLQDQIMLQQLQITLVVVEVAVVIMVLLEMVDQV